MINNLGSDRREDCSSALASTGLSRDRRFTQGLVDVFEPLPCAAIRVMPMARAAAEIDFCA